MDNNSTAQAIVAANPNACYRTLERKFAAAGLFAWAAVDMYAVLDRARPKCGYGCDSRCPTSGRAER